MADEAHCPAGNHSPYRAGGRRPVPTIVTIRYLCRALTGIGPAGVVAGRRPRYRALWRASSTTPALSLVSK